MRDKWIMALGMASVLLLVAILGCVESSPSNQSESDFENSVNATLIAELATLEVELTEGISEAEDMEPQATFIEPTPIPFPPMEDFVDAHPAGITEPDAETGLWITMDGSSPRMELAGMDTRMGGTSAIHVECVLTDGEPETVVYLQKTWNSGVPEGPDADGATVMIRTFVGVGDSEVGKSRSEWTYQQSTDRTVETWTPLLPDKLVEIFNVWHRVTLEIMDSDPEYLFYFRPIGFKTAYGQLVKECQE